MKKNNFKKSSIVVMLSMFLVSGLISPMKTTAFASPATVNLLSAANFTIILKTAISTTGATTISGDLGISPAAATFVTGFGLVMDASNTFSTSSLVTGNIYAADYAAPTPSYVGTAVVDMEAAYVDAAGRLLPDSLNFNAGNLGGQNLAPGLYKWTTGVTIPTNLTLTGTASDVWIFQIAGNLDISSATSVLLAGGALPANIFWAVAGTTTLNTTSVFEGNILAGPATSTIAMLNGATLHGRALGQKDVTMIANNVVGGGGGTATLKVVKTVVNTGGGVTSASAFNLHVKLAGSDVSGSPASGVTSPGRTYILSAGTYAVSEVANTAYTQSFSGDCDSSGNVTLASGNNKVCTITNTYIMQGGGGGGGVVYCTDTITTFCRNPIAVSVPYVAPVIAPVIVPAVIIPTLPKTGFPPREENSSLGIIALSGLLAASLVLYVIRKKQVV